MRESPDSETGAEPVLKPLKSLFDYPLVLTPRNTLNSPYFDSFIMADMMDKTISAILTAFVAVILIASAFIPTAIQQIDRLNYEYGSDAAGYTALISTVIIVTIVGIIIGIVKTYTGKGEGDR